MTSLLLETPLACKKDFFAESQACLITLALIFATDCPNCIGLHELINIKLENKKISTMQLTEIPIKTGCNHMASVIDQIRNRRQPLINMENELLLSLMLADLESYL